jgi:hypothetical protein
VINRIASFDFSNYSKQIGQTFPTKGYWHVGTLWKWSQLFSSRLADNSLTKFLSKILVGRPGAQDGIAWAKEKVAELVLLPESPPREVPVFGKNLPKRPVRLNLSVFASIPFLIVASILLFYLLISLW